MTVEFERFGKEPFVDDRWVVEAIGRLGLSHDTDKFMSEATRRIYDSERISWDWAEGGSILSDDEWNLLQFTLAFAGEAQNDTEPATAKLVLEKPKSDRFNSGHLRMEINSGERNYSEEPFTKMAIDDTPFFRNMVMYLEAAFGTPDASLTMPNQDWLPSVTTVNGWNLIKTVEAESQIFTIQKT
jgi:hypothetical protein